MWKKNHNNRNAKTACAWPQNYVGKRQHASAAAKDDLRGVDWSASESSQKTAAAAAAAAADAMPFCSALRFNRHTRTATESTRVCWCFEDGYPASRKAPGESHRARFVCLFIY